MIVETNFFRTFENRCLYNTNFTKIAIFEVVFINMFGFMKHRSEHYGLIEERKNSRKNDFIFKKIVKLGI